MATVIGFLGSAFGTVGGVGGGGIFVPMLTLVVGFDAKSAAALSKCMDTTVTAARPLSSHHHEIDNCVFLVRYDHGGIGFISVVQPQSGAPFQGSAHHRLQPGSAVPAHADAGDHHRCGAQRGLPLLAHHHPYHNSLHRLVLSPRLGLVIFHGHGDKTPSVVQVLPQGQCSREFRCGRRKLSSRLNPFFRFPFLMIVLWCGHCLTCKSVNTASADGDAEARGG